MNVTSIDFIVIIAEFSNNNFFLKQMLGQIYDTPQSFLRKINLSSRGRAFILIRYNFRSRYLNSWTSVSFLGCNSPYFSLSVYAAMFLMCYTCWDSVYLVHLFYISFLWRLDIFSCTSFFFQHLCHSHLLRKESLCFPKECCPQYRGPN